MCLDPLLAGEDAVAVIGVSGCGVVLASRSVAGYWAVMAFEAATRLGRDGLGCALQ